MRTVIRRRPSPALIVACIALLVALGGTSIAAVTAVPNDSVGTAQLKNNAVTAAKIKDGQVTTADLASNAVTAAKIKDGQVTTADLASNAVTSAKIANDAVTNAKIGKNAVTSTEVTDYSLHANDFAPGQLPHGPQGPQGPAGAQGPAGPAGPPGVTGLERRDTSTSTDSSSSKSVSATCPSGKRVVGGGARVTGAGAGEVSITESFPDSDGTKWNAVAVEVNATAATWQLTAYALCATVAS